MRVKYKRIISLILVITLMFGAFQNTVHAENTSNNTIYHGEGYDIVYKETSAWDNHVNSEVTIINTGSEPITEWELEFTYPAKITSIWNAEIKSQKEEQYLIKAMSYNIEINSGSRISFGFIAEISQNINDMPKNYLLTSAESRKAEEVEIIPEENDDSGITSKYVIPQKWRGLNHAIFTSSYKDLELNTYKTFITGDIHSNRGFAYSGTILQISGKVDAVDSVKIQTSSMEGAKAIGAVIENSDYVEMPDITNELKSNILERSIVYNNDKSYDADYIPLSKPIVVNGNVSFNGTTFLGQGIVYANNNISYNVNNLATPDNSKLFLCSENGEITLSGSDINMNAVIYAPNGCVYINANNFTLNGRIIAEQVNINGSIININSSDSDLDLIDYIFVPDVKINIQGLKKENRKVVFDLLSSEESMDVITGAAISWTFTKNIEENEGQENCRIDEYSSNDYHKEMIFTRAGEYTVEVDLLYNGNYHTITEQFSIMEDMVPVANFSVDKTYLRDSSGSANVLISDLSFSQDGDVINNRTYTIWYDENNNDEFEDHEASILSTGNETSVSFVTQNVGKYKVELSVTELLSDTIEVLITEEDYRKADTSLKVIEDKVFEVANIAPKATIDIAKSKSADIVFTLGSTTNENISLYAEKSQKLEQLLKNEGIDAKISTISTSTLTAQDTFAWKEYDHYNYRDRYLPTLEKHIIYTEKDIKMLGYSYAPLKDFLYVADDNPGMKIFEFDLQRDSTDWHSMEGGGFLFNTTISDESNSINGFCILVTQTGLKLVQIKNANINNFRNGSYNYVQNAGSLLRTFPMSDLYANHHIRIITDSNCISVWDGDKLIVDNYVLPENDYSYGYGPIISHASHGCRQQSYFTFKNITMQTIKGDSMSDILGNYPWRSGASHYVINLSDDKVPELSDAENTAALTKALIEQSISFIGIGNTNNEEQFSKLVTLNDGGGLFLSSQELASSLEQTNDYIRRKVLSLDYTIGQYITTEDYVSYSEYYSDIENDPLYQEEWEYEYDPTVFGESAEGQHIILRPDEPITQFENTGAYTIKLRVCDNPVGDNETLSEYRLWSQSKDYHKLMVVQTKPIAELSYKTMVNPADKTLCTALVEYRGYDLDHPSDSRKGIRKEAFYYKNVNDSVWSEGRLPNKLTVGETYLVKYIVTDIEGCESNPAVSVIKTSDLKLYETPDDNEAPEVIITLEKNEVEVGEEVRIDGYATDNIGVDTFELYVDGELSLNTFGRVFYKGAEGKEVVIKAVATDLNGNRSEATKTMLVLDNTDRTPPTVKITSPKAGGDISFNIQIRGTVSDDRELKGYELSYRNYNSEEYIKLVEGTSEITDTELITWNTEVLSGGVYELLLQAEDATGNKSYASMLLTIVKENSDPDEDIDRDAPLAAIGQLILSDDKSQIQIYGVADDENFKQYELTYMSLLPNSETNTIAISAEAVNGDILGAVDVDTIEVGEYLLTLTVDDKAGNQSIVTAMFTYTKSTEEGYIELPEDKEAPLIDVKANHKETESGILINFEGSIIDDNMKSYELKGKAPNEEEFAIIYEGTLAVVNGSIASYFVEDIVEGDYKFILTAEDLSGNKSVSSLLVTITEEIEGIGEKTFNIILSKSIATMGEIVKAYVTLPTGVKAEDVILTVDGKETQLDGKYVEFTSDKAKEIIVTAKTVIEGIEETVEVTCKFYNADDVLYPTVQIDSPEDDSVITKETDIIGSAYDETEIDFYTLEYRMTGSNEYILIKESTEAVRNGVLGRLDTTLLMNGRYDIRLTVVDKGGNQSSIVNSVFVEGNLKVGNMYLSFTDISTNVVGVPLDVIRSYDSRNKSRGDFGVGWTLGMQSIKLIESYNLSEGYSLVQSGSGFSTTYQLKETQCHDIIVAYGDGTTDRFAVTLSPNSSALVPLYETKVTFTCKTNPNIKLEYVGDNSALVRGGIFWVDYVINQNGLFKLTTEDGTEIFIDKEKGLQKIVDTNGNYVTISRNGFEHSSGKGVSFERDRYNRITKATDTNGNVTAYYYDEAGNLASVTDFAGRTVSYEYDGNHNLTSIIDPSGIAIARSEYDENGRLIAVIDAEGNRMEYIHDVEGRTQSTKDRMGNTTVNIYDDKGNILKTVDALGNATYKTYDANNKLLTITDHLGNVISYEYDTNGKVTKFIDELGNTKHYTYDLLGNVISETDPNGNISVRDYDERGNLLSESDKDGTKLSYKYDSYGRMLSEEDTEGNTVQYTYNSDGLLLTYTDFYGNVTHYKYNSNGKVEEETIQYADGKTEVSKKFEYDVYGNVVREYSNTGENSQYEYDTNGKLKKEIDMYGQYIIYEYDILGNTSSRTYSNGKKESYTYDLNGNVLTYIDKNNKITVNTYDKLNRKIKTTYDNGSYETFEYTSRGELSQYRNALGNIEKYTYDATGNNIEVLNSVTGIRQYEYDKNKMLTCERDAYGNETRYEYDNNGRCIKTIYANGTYETFTFDLLGNMTSKMDCDGNKILYTYDLEGNVLSVEDSIGNKTRYEYDLLGNRISETDANGNKTQYKYDISGNLIETILPSGKKQIRIYDSLGRLVGQTDYNQDKTSFEYDAEGRLTKKLFADSLVEEYDYYADGRVKAISGEQGTEQYEWNLDGKLAKKIDCYGNAISYEYNYVGNVVSVTSEIGSVKYTYDTLGRQVSVTDYDGLVTEYEYDSNGNLISEKMPNGNVTTYVYNNVNQLIEEKTVDAKNNVIFASKYILGNSGQKLESIENTGRKLEYTYDKLYRLIKEVIIDEDGNTSTTIYEYDAVGNRSKMIKDGSETVYAYNKDNQLVKENDITYHYDASGNLIEKIDGSTMTNYIYDYNNRLIEIIVNGTSQYRYTYDFDGYRIEVIETIDANSNNRTRYIWDSNKNIGQVAYEKTSSNDSGETVSVIYTYGNMLISQERNGNKQYYVYDGQLSVRALTDTEGTITDTYCYDAYGNIISRTGESENSYLYTGQQYDANTGFYYLRARYLNPSNGRFITRDLYRGNVFEPQTLHKYAYVCNDPVNNYDPRGLWMENIIKGILAHKWINARYIMAHPDNLVNKDRYLGRIVYGGSRWGYVDIIDYITNEIYEIKPWKGTVDGVAQVKKYFEIIKLNKANHGNFSDIESLRLGNSWPIPARVEAWPLGGVINYFLEQPGLICYSLYNPDPDPIRYRSWELLRVPEFRLEMTPVVAVAILTLALPGLIAFVQTYNSARLETMKLRFGVGLAFGF